MAPPGVSVQLIVFGQRSQEDIAGVLHDVAAAGFPAIETGNLFQSCGEARARQLLEENSLQISGAHFGYGDYADPERLAGHIAYAKAVGLKHLLCSGVADGSSAEGYRKSADVFNAVGRRLADEGLMFHYHNHDWEFRDLGGVTGMEILAQETDPALVRFNLDVFWLYYAGQDPAEFIRQHAGRAGYFHFKDGRRHVTDTGKRPEFLELGRGDVDLQRAYAAAVEVGAEWIVAEQDSTQLTPEEAITVSRQYLRNVLGL